MTKSKFGGQFIPVPRWALEYLHGDYIALAVLVHALQYMDTDTQQLTTSYDHLAQLIGSHRTTVIKAIKRLEATGVLHKTIRHGKHGNNQTNRYTVDFNNPASGLRGGSPSATRGGSASATTLVVPALPSGGSPSATQSIETYHNLEGGENQTKEKDLFLSDPKWERQFKLITEKTCKGSGDHVESPPTGG